MTDNQNPKKPTSYVKLHQLRNQVILFKLQKQVKY